jgi:hypothetical protein
VPLNIIAALAVKKVMEREHLPGTIRLWPGVAEELVATKAYYVRDGMFKDVDVCLFAYKSFLRSDDKPAIWLNKETMEKYRPQMQKMYYDAAKYDTYLEQLGIKYPTVH